MEVQKDVFYPGIELMLSSDHGYVVQEAGSFRIQMGWGSPLFLQRGETDILAFFKVWLQKRRVLGSHCYLSSKNVAEISLAMRSRSPLQNECFYPQDLFDVCSSVPRDLA